MSLRFVTEGTQSLVTYEYVKDSISLQKIEALFLDIEIFGDL